MFTHAITRQPGSDYPLGLTTASLPTPDFSLTLAQHEKYIACLRDIGLNVEELPPATGFPDACFVEDTAVVVPEIAVISRPGAPSRLGEAQLMTPALARYRPVVHIEAPGTLDGGDVLQAGRQMFIGISDRTNELGARQLAEILIPHGYACHLIPVAAGLHLKSSLNYVGKNTMLVTRDFASHPAIQDFSLLVAPLEEEYAANTLLVNNTLIMPAGYPKTRDLLRSLGLPIRELDTSEFRKMDGGLSCLSLRLEGLVS
ncbi:hydrolase [Desulfovibrionales bacterium]